uniref:Bcl2 modifying factor n=1 Tax=Ovis aries TaxID=9940 RepID=A0AC11EEA1_SHEEP
MEPPQCVEELEDDVFQPEDGEPGAQPRRLLSADLFAQSQLDCPLSRLQLFPLTHCCGPGLRPTSQEDKATQTLSPASPSQGVMLPCGVTEEPQRLFYGNAGYRLPLPASFPAGLPLGDQPPEGQWQHRAEIQIARKLQCIADQFHRLHMQQDPRYRDSLELEIENGPGWMSAFALTYEIQVVYLPAFSSGPWEMLRSLLENGIASCSLD